MLRADNNPWIKEIADQLVLGTSHVLTYLRTTGENGYEGYGFSFRVLINFFYLVFGFSCSLLD